MGKGYYFTLSIEIPKEIPEQKAKEVYSSQKYVESLVEHYGCGVDFLRIANHRAEYKVFMYDRRDA
jgi:hypothetical protein